jgi:hypothetical protein
MSLLSCGKNDFEKTLESFRQLDEKSQQYYDKTRELIRQMDEKTEEWAVKLKKMDERRAKSQAALDKALHELIGHDLSYFSDEDLTPKFKETFKKFLIEDLSVPEEAVDYNFIDHIFLYNTTNGNPAVGWDGYFVLNHDQIESRDITNFNITSITQHNNYFLLEETQNESINEVLEALPFRINTTLITIHSKFIPTSNYIQNKNMRFKLQFQETFFTGNPTFFVVIAAENMNSTMQQTITNSGYFAIAPSGGEDEFKVLMPAKPCKFTL